MKFLIDANLLCEPTKPQVGLTMIAASAKHHGLTVATRNVDDFRRCGVRVINPFE